MMKIVITLLIIVIVALLIALGYISKSGKAPGLSDGKLLKCANKANCVCSEYKGEKEDYISPLIIPQHASGDSLQILKATIKELGAVIETENNTYIAATFSSSVFGFVDDLEVRLDPVKNVIHFRSSSRVGYSDFGVNKKRVELIKDLFFKKTETLNNQ
ncbi:MAG: DUF1499 domain-containing protein [Psychromonas sp.]|nr:DUF1499 domain-containing protein [Psychromonas sp.]